MVIAGVTRKKNNPNHYVLKDDCKHTHEKIDLALWGQFDGKSGLVKDIADIKSDIRIIRENIKGKLSGKDKAVILGAVITAVASLAASLIALLKG